MNSSRDSPLPSAFPVPVADQAPPPCAILTGLACMIHIRVSLRTMRFPDVPMRACGYRVADVLGLSAIPEIAGPVIGTSSRTVPDHFARRSWAEKCVGHHPARLHCPTSNYQHCIAVAIARNRASPPRPAPGNPETIDQNLVHATDSAQCGRLISRPARTRFPSLRHSRSPQSMNSSSAQGIQSARRQVSKA